MKMIFLLVILYLTHSQGINRGFGPGEQDYGYATVREGAHMFWWLYHTTANVADSSERPLILWLVGGPGGSSCGSGNFMLVGPLDEKLNKREDNWVDDFNILFVDSPVGSGYSYVENTRLLNDNDVEVAQDLVKLMEEFYNVLPKFKTTPLYVFGIGYGGKIGVEFTRLLLNEIKAKKIESNLKGVSSTGTWISPMDYVLTMAQYLYQVSLVDNVGKNRIEYQANGMKEFFDDGKYLQTTIEWYLFMNMLNEVTDGINLANIIYKVPEITSLSGESNDEKRVNYLKHHDVSTKDNLDLYLLMNGPVKIALNIPENITWLPLSRDVNDNLVEEFMKSSAASVESILNDGIEVHISNGNLDAVTSTPGQLAWIDKLSWENEQIYKNSSRTTMWVNNFMEGYYKKGGGLSFYWMNVAGQVIILDNPTATREFLKLMTGY